jgi:hypothetical protein
LGEDIVPDGRPDMPKYRIKDLAERSNGAELNRRVCTGGGAAQLRLSSAMMRVSWSPT